MLKNIIYSIIILVTLQVNQSNAQVQVGDTLPFWSVSYIDWPPLWGSPQWQFDAVCLRAGQHCYIFSEVGITPPADYSLDTMVSIFDQKYAPWLTAKYGPIPDALDNDPHIFIMWMDDPNWGGYFDPGQQMADSMVMATWNRHSSQHEMIYYSAGGNYIYPPTVAHELGHLLHWGQDHSPEPPVNPVKFWEEAWVDEGFSTFAAMYLDENIDQNDVNFSGFFSDNPDIPLIWFSSYNQVQLFMLYMYEHYGKWDYVSALISNQLNGIPGVEASLDNLGYTDNFNDAFANWCIANLIDDSVYSSGKYWYAHYNFGQAHPASSHSNFPTGLKTGNVTAYGSDYIRLNTTLPQPIQIQFNGEPGKALRIAVIKQDISNAITVEVVHLLPDANNQIIYQDTSFGIDHNRTTFAVMCVDSTVHDGESAGYTYSVSPVTGIAEYPGTICLQLYPNPVKDILYIPWIPLNGSEIEVSIIDLTGREVIKQISNQPIREIDIQKLINGMYFLRINNSGNAMTGRFVKQ